MLSYTFNTKNYCSKAKAGKRRLSQNLLSTEICNKIGSSKGSVTPHTRKFSIVQSVQLLHSGVGFLVLWVDFGFLLVLGIFWLLLLVVFDPVFIFLGRWTVLLIKRKFCMFLDNVKFYFSFGKQLKLACESLSGLYGTCPWSTCPSVGSPSTAPPLTMELHYIFHIQIIISV